MVYWWLVVLMVVFQMASTTVAAMKLTRQTLTMLGLMVHLSVMVFTFSVAILAAMSFILGLGM